MDETIVEIATDKVDSEVPSSQEGMLVEKLFDVDAVVKVGEAFAIIETSAEDTQFPSPQTQNEEKVATPQPQVVAEKIEEEIATSQRKCSKNRK